jgi:ABC-type transporter MlaC component
VLACGGCSLVGFIAALTTNADSTVNDYYSAIEQQNYSQAYTYLAVDTLTIQGEQISATQGSFALAAQVIDQQAGPVTSYSITSSSTNGDTATVVVHVTRSSGVAYDVHLQLTRINSEWKITQLDNI